MQWRIAMLREPLLRNSLSKPIPLGNTVLRYELCWLTVIRWIRREDVEDEPSIIKHYHNISWPGHACRNACLQLHARS